MKSRLLFLGAIAFGFSFSPPASAQELFWTEADTGEIWTSRIDGGDPHVLISGVSRPIGIAVDADGGFLYWGEDGWGAGRVARSTLDGNNVTTIVGGLGYVQAVALDKAGGKVYWTEHYEHTGVSRANLDGSGVESLHSANQRYGPLALDLVNGHVYFGSPQWSFLQRMNLDGSGYTEVQPAGWAPDWTLHSLAIDPGAGKLYLTAGTAIWSSDLEGNNIATVVTGLDEPVAVSLSPNAAQLFWVDSTSRRLGAVTLDGGGQTFLQESLGNPAGVAALTSYDIPPQEKRVKPRVSKACPVNQGTIDPASGAGCPPPKSLPLPMGVCPQTSLSFVPFGSVRRPGVVAVALIPSRRGRFRP